MTIDTINIRNTSLHHVHSRLGASFAPYAGWNMPARYTSKVEEHHAVRGAAGLFDLSHRGQMELRGPGSGEALDWALTGWISRLEPGEATYTMLCHDDGGVIDDVFVYCTAVDEFLVVPNASNHETVLAQLIDRSSGSDTTVVDTLGSTSSIAIHGPLALEILQDLTGADIEAHEGSSIVRSEIHRVPVKIAFTGELGEDGFEIFVNTRESEGLWSAILGRGALKGLKPAGLECRETLGLEAGKPLYGHELGVRSTPFPAGLGRFVCLEKPADFVGRAALDQAVSEVADYVLVGLHLDGPRSAQAGQTLVTRGTDEPVGSVTRGAHSPTLGHPIAMAYVDSNFAEPATELAVSLRGRRERARVVAMPFYRRAEDSASS